MRKLWKTVVRKREVQVAADPAPAIPTALSSPSAATPSRQHQDALQFLGTAPSSSHLLRLDEAGVAPFGFKMVYEPSSLGPATVDIIAIHGLNGHREKTWTEVTSDGRETMWLRDLVSKSIPSARVITYGYDAEIDGPSHQTLSGHAQDFVVRLTQFRTEDRDVRRPIIFIVHGTGGIVLQLALLEAFRANEMHLPDREAIKFSTYGIIFLGTPHQGLSSTSLSRAKNKTAHVLNSHLQPNSEYLEDLVTMFNPIRGYFDIKFVYETRPGAGQTHLTVLKSSATLPGAANIEVLGLNRDHAGLSRFASEDDADYSPVAAMLSGMALKAPEKVLGHWQTRSLGVQAIIKTAMEETLKRYIETSNNAMKEEPPIFKEGLPPPPMHIFGREAEIQNIENLLLNNPAPRVAILGPGGIGKTTIACEIMNHPHVLHQFPSPLFVSCENKTTLSSLLHTIANVLHMVPDQRGQLLEVNIMDLLRQRYGGLLCLDNFEDPWDPPQTRREIETFLAALNNIQNLGIIVTMRGTERPRGLKWTDPPPLQLQVLKDVPALAFFEAVARITDERSRDLIKQLDNVPLAIELLGRLVDEEGLDYTMEWWAKEGLKIMDRGDASDSRSTSVTASINLSLNSPRISSIPHILEVLGILAFLPDGLSESMIDVLKSNLPPNVDLRRVLQALKRVALCYLDPNGRYRLLAPIRQHVEKALSLDPGFFDGVRKTFLKHVIGRVTLSYHDVVVPELANIRLSIDSESTWNDTDIIACLDYLWWEQHILGIRDVSRALIALSRAHTPILQVRCRLRVSELLRFSLRKGEAREYLFPALSIKTGRPYWAACVRLEMGNIERMLGRYEDAESFLRQAVGLFKVANTQKWEGVALGRLGTLLFSWGRTFEAEVPLIQSLELARNFGGTLDEGNALRWLGTVYLLMDRMSEAEDALSQAINCYQKSHSAFNEGLAFRSFGQVQYMKNDLEESEKSFVTSREIAVRFRDSAGEADALRWLGLLYLKMNQLELAKKHLTDGLVIAKQNDLPEEHAYILAGLGSLYSLQDHSSKALTHWVISIAFHLRRLHWSKWTLIISICGRIREIVEEGSSIERDVEC